MTELMKQLQQWANEGLYRFPEGDKKGYLKGTLEDPNSKDLTVIGTYHPFSIGGVHYRFSVNDAIRLVLDGTIQVWRPVEHYPPPENTILCLGLGVRIGNVEEKQGVFWLPTPESTRTNAVKITHWQPLLPPPQKGGEG